ncbi:PREDICTED: uncharacterized protein LOC105977175 [Erythranthe guttata]|uniref:uncharacterized protein LOC105977175 n=1 Tax=Erythranthe guttata TaxID=4155 RepID=UPI00064DCEC5|nr:PREDICTED: uncharacterized protein LOC105977175 [Erythranthe guttata]|eukprot:XP_012857918.1 PREDICTED: uncharacterized protein LOC105977175 [Erythranthe guttata]
MKKFKENPKLGTTEFRNEVCTTLKASVSKSKAYRAKQKALKAIQGSEEEQFQKIRSYCEELKRTDTNATVVLKLTEDTEGLRFQRLYICFSACKEGFKNACRSVIGVDGCFLKGQRGGQLLAAVGLDPNNNIYPICYAIVEGETKETWMCFLQLLDEDIGFEEQHKWRFMSDKQKGLIPAFKTLFPGAENRFCVRHLHVNMKKDGFGGMAIKSALWAAAKATRIEEFKRRMEELRAIDEAAYNWLVKKPPQNWTRSHFNPFPKCDILLNNMCECFNSFILDAREKPIIPMLECIRNLLMARMVLNREKALKWDTSICPKIRIVLIKNMKEAGECIPMKSDEWNFQIVGMYDQHTVDIRAKSCSCRRWDLTGVQESREEPDQGGQESREEPVTQQSTAAMNVSQRGETQVPQRNMQMQINEGSSVSTPVIVKGGVNFITMSNLRSAFGIQGSTSSANPFTAPRPAKKPTQSKNGSKKTT